MRSLSLHTLEEEARVCLSPPVHDFFAGGAEDEVTLRANETAFARVGLVPRVLRGGSNTPDLRTSILGQRLALPVLAAPTAFHQLAHPDGERATARACAAAGTTMIAAMASTVAIEQVVAAARERAPEAPAPWFQLYLQPDLDFTAAIVRRAQAAGCAAIVLSVDSPAFGRRERDLRNGFVDLPDGMWCENLRDPESGRPQTPPRPIRFMPASWQHVDWLRSITTLPVVLKGIAHPEDARLAVGCGAAALIVSNHGGRQLDGMPSSLALLSAVAEAVGDALPVLLDGGIRRGSDVVKAMALGASAVAVGRPLLWGLAIDGETGVGQVIAMLRAELERTLLLCGCLSLRDVRRELVRLPLAGDPC